MMVLSQSGDRDLPETARSLAGMRKLNGMDRVSLHETLSMPKVYDVE